MHARLARLEELFGRLVLGFLGNGRDQIPLRRPVHPQRQRERLVEPGGGGGGVRAEADEPQGDAKERHADRSRLGRADGHHPRGGGRVQHPALRGGQHRLHALVDTLAERHWLRRHRGDLGNELPVHG